MTISTTPRRAGPYATNGSQTVFAFAFKVFDADALRVVEYFSDGSYNTLNLTGDYTVTLNADQDASPGGSITTVQTKDNTTILITSDMDIEQPSVFTNTGGFYPRVLNDNFDRLTMLLQQTDLETKRSFRVSPLEEDITPLNATAAERANKYPVFDATGRGMTFSKGTGADSGLRGDLAANANELVRTIFPGFPNIVSTLGDWMPTVAASTFFGINSNGSTDDTAKWNEATLAMQHSTNPKGRTIFNEPGQPSLIAGEVVIRPGVEVNLRGGMFDAQRNGGSDAGVRMMSNSKLVGGSVIVTSTNVGASQAGAHAPILMGALQGQGGTAAVPNEHVSVRNAYFADLLLSSTRDGGVLVVLSGDVRGVVGERIRVPDNANIVGVITLDAGIVGETTYMGNPNTQGIRFGAEFFALNKAAYLAWVDDNATGAYTTHPSGNSFSDWLIGSLTRAYVDVDTGTYMARVSGGHGNVFENFHGDKTTEASFIHHAGDPGYEFARPQDKDEALLGNKFLNFTNRDAYRGFAAKIDSYADNFGLALTTNQRNADGTLSGSNYTPIDSTRPPSYPCDVLVKGLRARTGEAANAIEGLMLVGLNGGRIVSPSLIGFKNNMRVTDSDNVDIVKFSGQRARQHGILIHDGSTNIKLIDTKRSEYSGQTTANTYDDLHIAASTGVVVDGGVYGADSATPQCRSSIRTLNAADGVTGLVFKGEIKAMANGADNAAFKLGASNDDPSLCWEFKASVRFGGNVTKKYDGLWTFPLRRRVNNGGLTLTDWQSYAANTFANYTVYVGDQVIYQNPPTGGSPGRVFIADGTVDGTGSNLNALSDPMPNLTP